MRTRHETVTVVVAERHRTTTTSRPDEVPPALGPATQDSRPGMDHAGVMNLPRSLPPAMRPRTSSAGFAPGARRLAGRRGIVDATGRRHLRSLPHGRGRTRFSLGRLLLALGAVFVGVGLIWLVAANLDQLRPCCRFAVVAAFWLAFLVGGEYLATPTVPPDLGAVRLMAALTFGATIFQAAQSMQVPAYEPLLLGLWSAGTLLHGYLTRAYLPLVVGIVTGVVWWMAQPLWTSRAGSPSCS